MIKKLFLLVGIVSLVWSASGQTSDYIIPTQRDQGLMMLSLLHHDGLLYTSGYDIPMFGQDSLLYPFLWRYLAFEPGINNLVVDSSANMALFDSVGYLVAKTDSSFLAIRFFDDSLSSTGVRFILTELDFQLNNYQEVMVSDYEFDGNRGSRPFYWQQVDSVAYFHFNGDTNVYVIGAGFTVLDTITLGFAPNTNRNNTPILINKIENRHYLYQGVSEFRQSNCFPNPCNRLDVRRVAVDNRQLQQVSLPAPPQFQPTGSPYLGSAFKNTDLKLFSTDTILGIAQANSHNRAPYTSYHSHHVSMSNHLVLFKLPTNMNASGIQLKYFPSQPYPIYANNETTLDFVTNEYIYVAATQVHDGFYFFPPHNALPYWSYFSTGVETSIKLMCLDRNLNVRWETDIYDVGKQKHMVDIVALPDSGVALLMHESTPAGLAHPMNLRLMVFDKYGTGISTSAQNETDAKSNWKVFPNPASNELFVQATEGKTVRMIDAVGKLVQEVSLLEELTRLEIAHLPTGLYFMQLEDRNGQIQTRKIVVNR